MNRRQFRVLYRQFLFRIVDPEVLSGDARGDANKLLGQFAALLVWISVGMSLPAIMSSDVKGLPTPLTPVLLWITQHLLIATTMLVVGLFAVLSWDATFPDRRDVMVLAPLPVRPRTMFLAKVAAVGTALGLTIVLLHGAMGLFWPLGFAAHAAPVTMPRLTFDSKMAPVSAGDLQSVLNRDLKQALTSGELAPGTGSGMAIGVWKKGERRVFTYGEARADSLFEIGSVSKTFTGLMLARMAAQGKVKLNEPVRELLPPGTVSKPAQGEEITLLDLATHHSGLPSMPDNFRPADRSNPYADYDAERLYAWLGKHGVLKTDEAGFAYSNLGVGLLGQALSVRAGRSYADVLRAQITGALGMTNTAIRLAPDQQRRFLQGHDAKHQPVHAWDLDALAGAGGIRSTAGDMLTYLEANLHPERQGAMAQELASSHRLRASADGGGGIALAWLYDPETGMWWHNGATAGFTAMAFFDPKEDCAGIVLLNRGISLLLSADVVGLHIRQRMAGEPAISLETVVLPASPGLGGVLRSYAAYWFTMLAAGVFIYCAVLGLQGLAAQLLSRRLFLRVSGHLQMAAFCAIMFAYFLQPGFTGLDDLSLPSLWRTIQWLPSYWFLGLYQQLNGTMHPAMEPLAHRAWIGLAVVLGVTSVSYAMSYWRTLRKIVEEPDIVAGRRGMRWLPAFGTPAQTAIGQFSLRTLARSRQHRMILAFYLGIGLAFISLLMKDPATKRQFTDGSAVNPWSAASIPLWTSGMMLMTLAVVGTRVAFAFPLDLRGNWVFRVVGLQGGAESRGAGRRALLLLAVAPVWLLSAVVCMGLWPSRQSALHLMVLGMVGATLAEAVLFRFRQIPFACSYLPGKSRFTVVLVGAIALFQGGIQGVLLERQAFRSAVGTAVVFSVLAAVWVCVRWASIVASRGDDSGLQFEDRETPVVQGLGLSRDGVVVFGAP
jgi:CubicO group peptidase (beta-lactamase class C family)